MFEAATLKLTGWYLAIVVAVSAIFSFVIYQINFHELSIRFETLLREADGTMQLGPRLSSQIISAQTEQAAFQILITLLWINVVVVILGGIGSYWLARRTLSPIQRAHNAERRFTSDASHELRTPLASMKAEIEVALRDKQLDPRETRQLLESNLEEVHKLIQVTNMLLDLSRLDYDRLEKRRIHLETVVKEALRGFKPHAKRFQLTGRKTAMLVGNRAALLQLVTILIDNAVKYSPADTPILLRLFQQGRSVGLEVSNSGPTIPVTIQAHLFDRFYRGDPSRTQSSQNGYGLGLAIAKKIVEVHDGEIKVSSRQQKTTFRCYLPISDISKPSPLKRKITTK